MLRPEAENIPIQEGLDRQNLAILKRRFETVNARRLQRMTEALNSQQRIFIQALPILFHSNHPMLPGYVSKQTPAKLANFQSTKEHLRIGKQLARSFSFQFDNQDAQILGIYIMGSVGTVAQSGRSDLDIWLCHVPNLNEQQQRELKAKCESISKWAASLKLEAHFFPMEPDSFRRGEMVSLDNESSGSTQRLLLLDEFYRSAVFIGGRMPLWWFVPASEEQRYNEHARTLLRQRFVHEKDVLDFGGVDKLPDKEFITAGFWQLYKAIESPYKSVLKLLLLEAYASERPKITPLSLSYKHMVYRGEQDIDRLDGYVLIYERIESYLKKNKQSKRLEIARRCFYFKVNRKLSKAIKSSHKSWQRLLMEKMTQEWGWDADKIAGLDKRNSWKTSRVSEERARLVSELTNCYQYLSEFTKQQQSSKSFTGEELKILGRKLQAAFERQPGKIEWINPGISNNITEDALCIEEHQSEESGAGSLWTLSAKSQGVDARYDGDTLKSSKDFVELILWCHFNGICNKQTVFDLQKCPSVRPPELRKLLNTVQTWLPQAPSERPHHSFQYDAVPTQILILINVGQAQNTEYRNQDLQRLSTNIDALQYSGTRESLIHSLDIIDCNSWHEIHCRRFEGSNAVTESLKYYLEFCPPSQLKKPPLPNIECLGSSHSGIIVHRIRSLFDEISRCFYGSKSKTATRYIFELAHQYHCIQFLKQRVELHRFRSTTLLMDYLGLPQASPSTIAIDSYALKNTPLRAIRTHLTIGVISVFYRRLDFGWDFYIADEKGAIKHFALRGTKDYKPLRPLHFFLRKVLKREAEINAEEKTAFGVRPLKFYEVEQQINKRFTCTPKNISTDLSEDKVFKVKAIANIAENAQISFSFVCDNQRFESAKSSDQAFEQTAQFITKKRRSKESYPVYIADINLEACREKLNQGREIQTSIYLHYKYIIESKLNQALGRRTAG